MEISIFAWLVIMFIVFAYIHETHDIATVLLVGILLVVALNGRRRGK